MATISHYEEKASRWQMVILTHLMSIRSKSMFLLIFKWLHSAIVFISTMGVGCATIFPTIAIPCLTNEDDTPLIRAITMEEASWYSKVEIY